jgi:hypothetical protein
MARVYIGGVFAGLLWRRDGRWFAENRAAVVRSFWLERSARDFIDVTFTERRAA